MRQVLTTLAAVALAIILFVFGQAANAVMLKDVPGDHWTYDVLGEFIDAEILEGYRTYKPYSISRYEAALTSARILEKLENVEIRAKAKPVHKLLSIALALEYEAELREFRKPMEGDEDFEPYLLLSEICPELAQEAITELRINVGVPRPGERPTVIRGKGKGMFRDVPDYHWSYKAIDKLQDYGLVEGYPDGVFYGRNVFSRYEMGMVVGRIAGKMAQMHGTKKIDLTTKMLLLAMMAEYEAELHEMGVNLFQVDREEPWILLTIAELKAHFRRPITDALSCNEDDNSQDLSAAH